MTEDQKAAYINAQAAVLFARVSGMVAENMQRQAQGHAMAYTEDAFLAVIDESPCHHNAVIEFFRT